MVLQFKNHLSLGRGKGKTDNQNMNNIALKLC